MIRRLFRALLALAPRAFRERYGDDLLLVHDARWARCGGRLGRLSFGLTELGGMAWTVLRLRLGGRDHRVERERGGGIMLDAAIRNIRYIVRGLRRQPGYALTAVVVLALGIGATTAIFSVANAFFFRPLPFADADRLVAIYETNPEFEWTDATSAPANLLDWRDQVDAFEDIAGYNSFLEDRTYLGGEQPLVLDAVGVTGNFFEVLGVRPEIGRIFRWEETWSDASPVVVLGHDTWTTLYGADPAVVGTMMEFGVGSAEIIGVMPAGFAFPYDDVQLWAPMRWQREAREQVWFRRAHWVRPVARLAPGVRASEADAQLQVVVERLSVEYPETNRVMGAGIAPLREFLVRDIRRPIDLLGWAVAILLLLACVNVASLALVRTSERTREVGVRIALGAGRRQVAGLLVQEAVTLALIGGLVGLGLAWAGVTTVDGLAALGIDGATRVALDARVVLFTLGVSVVSGLIFALVPILRLWRSDPASDLSDGGRGAAVGRRRVTTVRLLVAAEIALAVLLTAGAGLMVRTFYSLRSEDPGFRVEGVLGVNFSLPDTRYPSRDDVLAFHDRFVEALEARPEVERVGFVRDLPLDGIGWSGQMQAEGWGPERLVNEIRHRSAGPGYFEALDIPLVRGRMFGPQDEPDGPLVVLINEALAEQHFPGEEPIGQRVTYDRTVTEDSRWYEIIGIVADQHQLSPGTEPWPELYENPRQDWTRNRWMVIATRAEPLSVVPAVRSVLQELDPSIGLNNATTLRDVWRQSMAREQLILTLLGTFGIVALLLAVVGVYGITARAARSRTHEIGIRIALGALRRDVVRLVLRQGAGSVGLGLIAGLGLALLAGGALESMLYGVEANDVPTLLGVVLVLGGSAMLASWIPARRATRVDPVESLRTE